jgi:hypothetical protein
MWEEFRDEFLSGLQQPLSERRFGELSLELFRQQAVHNPVYREFIALLGIHPDSIQSPEKIPFLPVEVFRTREVRTGTFTPETVFSSSGTTGQMTARHAVRELSVYLNALLSAFRQFYGPPENWCILALLPSYLERGDSSLVWMAERLIERSRQPGSGFYLYDHGRLAETIRHNEGHGIPTLLLGVTFALLDFAESHPMKLGHTAIMETGGMKGRREELTREQVHAQLQAAFGAGLKIHSEYGMTELLGQAYSSGDGIFRCPAPLRVLIRDPTDPLSVSAGPGRGGLNIIDLHNVDSCAFLATSDIGEVLPDGTFRVLGRFDQADVRGCNLLVS